MTLTFNNAWACSAAISFGVVLLLMNPLTFWLTDTICGKKGYISTNRGSCVKLLGLFIHTIFIFFATFGILSINWQCSDGD